MRGLSYSNGTAVSGGFCILLALMVLILPFKWLLAALLAAAVHELFHIAAVKLLGGHIRGIRIGSDGARIEAAPMGHAAQLFCVLAGPIGSLSLLLFAKWIPRTAVCAVIQSAYNLLPLMNLDGGRALHCLIAALFSESTADKACKHIQRICAALMVLLGLYAALRLCIGWLPLLAAVWIAVRAGVIKIPCKSAVPGVQ